MTDEDLIARLQLPWPDDESVEEVTLPAWVLELCAAAANRIEALVRKLEQETRRRQSMTETAFDLKENVERLEAAIDYILDGMAINAPDYEIDPDDDFLDAANSDWVRDVLTRLAAALKGDDHE